MHFIYVDTTKACMLIYTYPVYIYLEGKSHTFGIAFKISYIFTLSVRYFMPMYVPFANIFALLCF